MSLQFVLILMFFFHIIDDYFLQGILASMKQKSWWEKNTPEKFYKYKHDYLAALLMHSFSWAFMIMLPIAIYVNFDISFLFIWGLIANCVIHGLVDHGKANLYIFNLVQDQAIHIVQIVVTYYLFLTTV